jgi:hypothetical protein
MPKLKRLNPGAEIRREEVVISLQNLCVLCVFAVRNEYTTLAHKAPRINQGTGKTEKGTGKNN